MPSDSQPGGTSVPADYLERLDFLEFDVHDARLLADLAAPYAADAAALSDHFYQHLLSFPRLRAILDDLTLARLKPAQRAYFERLFGGEYGRTYAESRVRVGAAHERVGLEPAWYIGSYALHLRQLLPLVFAHAGAKPDEVIPYLEALLKAVFLDLGLSLDSYIHAKDEDLQLLKEIADRLVECVPTGMVVLDSRFRVLSANRAFVRTWGGQERLEGRALTEILDAPALERHLREVQSSGVERQGLLLSIRIDGVSCPIRAAVSRMGAGGDEPARLVCVIEDLADSVHLTVRLRDEERRFHDTVEGSSDALAVLRADGSIYLFNRSAEALTGYLREEVAGRQLTALVGATDRDSVVDGLARCSATTALVAAPPAADSRGRSTTGRAGAPDRPAPPGQSALHVELVCRDGALLPVELRLRAERLDGEMTYVAELRDPAHERSQEVHRRLEGSLRDALDRSPSFVAVHRRGRLVYVNTAAALLLGYDDPTELAGRSLLELVALADREAATNALLGTSEAGELVSSRELHLHRQGGGSIVLQCSSLPLVFEGDLAQVLVGEDVGARDHLHPMLMQMDRLISAGTLAATVTREMERPLDRLAAALRLLEQDLAGERPNGEGETVRNRIRATLREAQDSAAEATGIVDLLRTLSSPEPEAGLLIDVRSVLESVLHLAGHEVNSRATLVREYGDVPLVEASNASLAQVFLNLIMNAAEAIPPGERAKHQVRVRTYRSDGHAVIEVQDTGSGLSAEQRERLFEPFYTTKGRGRGTGLGLAIARSIVSSFGGQIEVESDAGAGSTFRVRLPGARMDLPATAEPTTLVKLQRPQSLVTSGAG
jgi:PAS domain S-box-containing protein